MWQSLIPHEAAPFPHEQRYCRGDVPETLQTHALVHAVDIRGLGAVTSHNNLARILKQRRVEPRVGRARHRPQL